MQTPNHNQEYLQEEILKADWMVKHVPPNSKVQLHFTLPSKSFEGEPKRNFYTKYNKQTGNGHATDTARKVKNWSDTK